MWLSWAGRVDGAAALLVIFALAFGLHLLGGHPNLDLLIDAAEETFASAGVTKDDVDAYWLGTAMSGMSGMALARPLQLHDKPVTHVENFCATASEAIRNAAYAVASGAYDSAMAIGVEKVKDSGYQGLNAFPIPNDGTARTLTAAAMFSMVAPAYGKKYGVGEDELTDRSDKFMAAELIREKILLTAREEVPHSVAVAVEDAVAEARAAAATGTALAVAMPTSAAATSSRPSSAAGR